MKAAAFDYVRPRDLAEAIAALGTTGAKLLGGGQSDETEFTISQPGVYPFICSFPGHWGTMQGKIIAE